MYFDFECDLASLNIIAQDFPLRTREEKFVIFQASCDLQFQSGISSL